MDVDLESNLLSIDYRTPTISDDLSNTLVQSESKEQFESEKPVNNIGITQLLDAAVTVLDHPETLFQNIKSGSCQFHTIIPDSDDFDSDEVLSLDEVHSNVEPVPLELELSLLDYDLEDSRSSKKSDSDQTISIVSDLSSSASGSSSSSTSGNMEPTNFSRTNQMLINFDYTPLSLEEKAESVVEIKVQPRLRLSSERNGTEDGHTFSSAYSNEEIFNSGASSNKIPNDHQNSASNNVTKSNILAVNCNSSEDRSCLKHITIDDNGSSGKSVSSESSDKSQEKSNETLTKISNILKDFNDNIFDSYFDKGILSLESVDVKENDEVVPVKNDLSNPRLELKENSSSDMYTDPRLLHSSGTSLTFPTDRNCRSIPKNNPCSSCPLLKRKTSPHFVPSNDFRKRLIANKVCKYEIPPPLIVKTTLNGDRIKILNDDSGSLSSHENPVSSHIKSCQMVKHEVLKEGLKIDVKAEPEKCLKNKDSQIHNLTDVFIKEEAKISATIETPCDSSTMKVKSLTLKDTIQKDNPKNLCENSNLEVINSTCLDSKISAGDKQLDRLDKTTQKPHQTVKEHLKTNLEDKISEFRNRCRNSKDAVVLTSSFGKSKPSRNESQQYSHQDELKKKQLEGCVYDTSKDNSSRSLGKLMLNTPLMIISVNTDGGSQKRTVTLGKQLTKGENSFVTLRNKDDPVKSPSNDGDEMAKVGQSDKKLQIKTTSNLNKTHPELPLNKYICKDSKDLPKDSNMITGKIPTTVSLIDQYQTTTGKTVTKSKTVPQKNAVTTPMGVKKRNKAKQSSAKKRAKALCSLSKKKMGLLSQDIMASVKANNASTNTKSKTCSVEASSGSIPKAGSKSSSSTCKQTRPTDDANVRSEDASSKRKFVKAKRGLYKQKQQAICVDKSDVNDRVQWVCHRWNVETLTNQDINLTTASYIRRKLPVQEATCFQGCLEGQKEYTLAIVAPNRKRKLDHNDTNSVDYNASKRRRLGNEVQSIPDNVKELPPDRRLIGNKAIELLATSHSMCLIALDRQRNQEVNMFNTQYNYLKYQLEENHFQERQYYNYYRRFDQENELFRLQYEHNYQKQQFEMAMSSRYNDLVKKFGNKAYELHTLYNTSIEKLKSDLSTDKTDSGYLTVALRMGPNRKSGYKMTHRNVCLTSQVALAMIREDEIYDSFYSHKS